MDEIKLPRAKSPSQGDKASLDHVIEGKNLGVCVKKIDQTVVYQNALCAEKCGNRVGQVCTEGCMKNFSSAAKSTFDEGIRFSRGTTADNDLTETVIINDGQCLTTIFYLSEMKQTEQLAYFNSCGLTKAESKIMELVLKGLSNAEISEYLCLSVATIKTHLNHIYKKIPKEYSPEKLRRSLL